MTELAARASYIRSLSRHDLPELIELLDQQPLVNLFVRQRVNASRMDQRWLGAQIWGFFVDGELRSACHVGANIVPVETTSEAIDAFADRLADRDGWSRSLVGPAEVIRPLWRRLRPAWGPARSVRLDQPFLAMSSDSPLEPDPRVRPVAIDEIDLLFPASVAMFTEEVGVDPMAGDRGGYRARVAQLVSEGCAYAIIENDEVIFKAEVGVSTPAGCQLQGVWVNPRYRGQGVSPAALAGVIAQVRRSFAGTVTLYVNDFNEPARRLYDRVGFQQIGTFATVLM